MNIRHHQDNFYNYVYCDPRKSIPHKVHGIDLILPAEPFYVGRGRGRRKNNHLNEALGGYGEVNKFKTRKIRKIIGLGLKPIVIQINKNLSNVVANENERYLVRKIGRFDLGKGPLTNLTDGGETSAGYKMPKESIAKGVETKKKNGTYSKPSWRKGQKHTEEAKEKNRQAHLGKPTGRKGIKASPEAIEKNRLGHLGKRQSIETIERRRQAMLSLKIGDSILRFDLNGNFLQKYDSMSLATKELGGGIIHALKGRVSKAQGFIWVYEKDWQKTKDREALIYDLVKRAKPKPAWNKGLKNPDLSLRRSKKVYQLNPETLEIIRSFNKIMDAEDFVGKKGVRQSMKKDICCGGYKWKYA